MDSSGSSPPLVLVVEDRSSIRQLLRIALRQEGFRTVEAATADEALSQVRQEVPDVVLLDLLLPGTRGDSFIGALRRMPGARDIPVIVLSGIEGGQAASQAAGAQDFLPKPFDLRELVGRVRQHLTHSATTGTPA